MKKDEKKIWRKTNMKMMKKLAVLVAAMAMVLSLTACGGEKYPLTYTYKVDWAQGVRGEEAVLTLNEDGTCVYTYVSTDSNDANKISMDLKVTGTYTKEGDIVNFTFEKSEGYAMNGDAKIDCTADQPTWYALSYSQGATKFLIDGETFIPQK